MLPGGERCATGGVGHRRSRNKSLQPNDMEKRTQKKAEREFLVSEYFEDRTGAWRCEKPLSLPCGEDGEECRVWIHD